MARRRSSFSTLAPRKARRGLSLGLSFYIVCFRMSRAGELRAGFEAPTDAEVIQSGNVAAQDFAHLAGENLQREGLLEEGGSRLEYTMVNDGIFGIPGEVKHF